MSFYPSAAIDAAIDLIKTRRPETIGVAWVKFDAPRNSGGDFYAPHIKMGTWSDGEAMSALPIPSPHPTRTQ